MMQKLVNGSRTLRVPSRRRKNNLCKMQSRKFTEFSSKLPWCTGILPNRSMWIIDWLLIHVIKILKPHQLLSIMSVNSPHTVLFILTCRNEELRIFIFKSWYKLYMTTAIKVIYLIFFFNKPRIGDLKHLFN